MARIPLTQAEKNSLQKQCLSIHEKAMALFDGLEDGMTTEVADQFGEMVVEVRDTQVQMQHILRHHYDMAVAARGRR